MKSNLIKLIFSILSVLLISSPTSAKEMPYYYQLKIYHLQSKKQQDAIDGFLRDAYLPALHRAGIPNIGVFKPISKDSLDQLVYVFIPFKKIDDFIKLDAILVQDKQYQAAGKEYINASYNDAPYTRIESVLLKAFAGMPKPGIPKLTGQKSERVYELRSYESSTENLSLNKIGMFNDAEIDIFNKLNFNTVFYGQVISGSRMPNLMYLTTFNNKQDREKHWVDFGIAYKAVSALPQYQNNVAKNTILFLYPTDYSDL